MDIKYIEAALIVADHGDCGCTCCQSAMEILQTEASRQTMQLAKLATAPIRNQREQEEVDRQKGIAELDKVRWMTDRQYHEYLMQRHVADPRESQNTSSDFCV